MNFLKYILKGFGRQKLRTILAVLSIFFTFTMMITISLFFSSAQETDFESIERAVDFDIEIKSVGHSDISPEPLDVDQVVGGVEDMEGVTGVYPVIRGYGFTLKGGSPNHFVQLFGAREDLDIGHVEYSRGEYSLGNGKCVISSEAASSLGDQADDGRLDPGESVTINIPTTAGIQEASFEIAGVYDITGRYQQDSGFWTSPRIIVGLGDLQEIMGVQGQATHVLVTLDEDLYDLSDPTNPARGAENVALDVARVVGDDYDVTAPKAEAIQGGTTGFLTSLSYLFAILFPAISGILVSSVMNLSVEDKTRELAIMRLLGSRRSFIGKVVLLELGVILLAGIIPAVLLGSFLAQSIVFLFGLDLDLVSLKVSTQLIIQLIIAVLVTVLFSLAPILRALKTSPAESISRVKSAGTFRFISTERVDKKLVLTGWFVFGALMVAIISVIYLLRSPGDDTFCLASIGLMTVLPISLSIGLLGGVPYLEDGLARIFYPVTSRTNKIVRSYIKRNVRRNISTNLIFGTIVAILIMFTSIFSSVIGSSTDQVKMGIGSDVRIFIDEAGFGREDLDPISNMDGVESVSSVMGPWYLDVSDLIGKEDGNSLVYGIDENITSTVFSSGIDIVEGSRSDIESMGDEEITLSEGMAKNLKVGRGDVISVNFESVDDRPRKEFFEIAAVISQMPGFIGIFGDSTEMGIQGALLSHQGYRRISEVGGNQSYSSVFVNIEDEGSRKTVVDRLNERFGSLDSVFVVDTQNQIDMMNIQLLALNTAMTVISSILLVVAIFSLVINLYASIKEREYEIGVLKSVGLRKFEVLKALLSEGIVIAVASMLLGVVAGAVVAALGIYAFNTISVVDMNFQLPWFIIGYLALFTVGSAVFGSFFPAFLVSRKQVINLMKKIE